MVNSRIVKELRRAVANKRYEESEGGILFNQSNLVIGGVFETKLNDGPWIPSPNILPTEGLNAFLDITLGAVAKQTNWYLAPFAENVEPTSALTAANFNSTQTEFRNYAEATRALWTPATAAGGVITNAATPVSITIANGGTFDQFDMYGLALISASAKAATSGKLAACTFFKDSEGNDAPRLNLMYQDVLGLRYVVTLTSA